MAEELFDGNTLKAALLGAERSLEAHIDELNLLNVFPVPEFRASCRHCVMFERNSPAFPGSMGTA